MYERQIQNYWQGLVGERVGLPPINYELHTILLGAMSLRLDQYNIATIRLHDYPNYTHLTHRRTLMFNEIVPVRLDSKHPNNTRSVTMTTAPDSITNPMITLDVYRTKFKTSKVDTLYCIHPPVRHAIQSRYLLWIA
jgi:hypothetical protein